MRVYCDQGHQPLPIDPKHDEEWQTVRLKCPICRLDLQRKYEAWVEATGKLEDAGVTEVRLLALARAIT